MTEQQQQQQQTCQPPCEKKSMIGRSWWKSLGYGSPCLCAENAYDEQEKAKKEKKEADMKLFDEWIANGGRIMKNGKRITFNEEGEEVEEEEEEEEEEDEEDEEAEEKPNECEKCGGRSFKYSTELCELLGDGYYCCKCIKKKEEEEKELTNFKYPERCSKVWNVKTQQDEWRQYIGGGYFKVPEKKEVNWSQDYVGGLR